MQVRCEGEARPTAREQCAVISELKNSKPNMSSITIDFVKSVVLHDLGSVEHRISETLIGHGAQTREQVQKHTGLEMDEVKHGLIALVAHSIVSSRPSGKGAATSPFLYELDLETVPHRVCIPRFVSNVKEQLGAAAGLVVDIFTQRGKLLMRQLVDLCSAFEDTADDDATTRTQEEWRETRAKYDEAFRLLVQKDFLIQAVEQAGDVRAVKHRKLAPEASPEALDDGSTFWALNYAQLVWDLQRAKSAALVRDRVNATAATVVHLMMGSYPVEADTCSALSAEDVLELVRAEPGAPTIGEDTLRRYLGELSSTQQAFEQMTARRPSNVMVKEAGGYAVNLQHLLSELRAAELQTIVVDNFGRLAGRVFRLLLAHEVLEEAQVAELATAPTADVEATLTAMRAGSFVSLRVVTRGKRKFRMWRVPLQSVTTRILESFYCNWVKTKETIVADQARLNPILDKMRSLEPELTAAQVDEFDEWQRVDISLQLALSHLAESIVLFRSTVDSR
jgi:hypothetical protein